MQSPLRYPGSKSSLVDYFDTVIKENLLAGCDLFELYAGGASLSLGLLERETISRTTLVEKDPLLYALWKVIATQPDALCERIERYRVDIKEWRKHRRYLQPDALKRFPLLELGAACLFLNRTSFSGVLGAGPIGGRSQRSEYSISCRLNKARLISQISAIAKFRRRITVAFGDALNYLSRNRSRFERAHCLVYFDPPYFIQGRKLYRYWYEPSDHEELATAVCGLNAPWIASSDDVPEIRRIFAGQKIVPIRLNYAVKQSRRARELLISNFPLTAPRYERMGGESAIDSKRMSLRARTQGLAAGRGAR
jgi:DNA adenine methylase